MTYKYSLDRSSKKFICPSCHKKTFVKYIDNESREYLSENYGRCDRETNCRHHVLPNNTTLITLKSSNEEIKTSYHSFELLSKSLKKYDENNFVKFLENLFSVEDSLHACRKYYIGTSRYWKGATIFWQVDKSRRVHAGKILQYDAISGKRSKNQSGKSQITWVHSVLRKENKLTEFNLSQCLFGLHLVNEHTKKVAIVEGEKTAVIMSIFKPEYIWLATGSKEGFKSEMLQSVKSTKIYAFPDKGEYSLWKDRGNALNNVGYKISVDNTMENLNSTIGSDLADILIEKKFYC